MVTSCQSPPLQILILYIPSALISLVKNNLSINGGFCARIEIADKKYSFLSREFWLASFTSYGSIESQNIIIAYYTLRSYKN